MKLTRFTFAVLALMSVFTACTKEEMPTPQAEVNGANLLGKNLSAEFPIASETKTDAQGNWVVGDKLGLAWFDNTNNLKANHMFVKETNDGSFTSYGNIYEGEHFAYYPYVYMSAQGTKTVVINPSQTETADKDIFKTRLHLSTKEGLTAAHNLDGDKLVNTNLKVRRAVKALNVTLNINEDITTSNALKGLKIRKVSLITTGDDPMFFGGKVDLNPNALASPVYVDKAGKVVPSTDIKNCNVESHKHTVEAPAAVYPAGATFSEAETAKAFYASLMNVFGTPTYTKSLVTEVENDNINLGANQVIRFYTLPKEGVYSADLYKSLQLKVEVQNGFFLIKFETGNNLSTAKQNNIAALKALADLYKVTGTGDNTVYGYLAAFTSAEENTIGHSTGLTFTLDESMFEQSFGNIASEDDWNAAVAMVDALNLENPTFNISNSGDTKWAFTDKDNDGQLVNLPARNTKVTVTGDAMYFDKADAIAPITSSSKFVVTNEIIVKKDLKVVGNLKAAKVTNNAVITADASANIENLNNNNRVIVAFGAKLITPFERGTVAYVVNSVSQEDYANVSTMITNEAVKVNTLVVDGVAFNIHAKCVSAGSYETNNTYLSETDHINKVNFELTNGGSLVAVKDSDDSRENLINTVAKVSALSGNTAITGVQPTDSLLVKAGVMTATDAAYNVVKVSENATLNINSAKTDALVAAAELNVDGILNSNVYGLTVDKVVVNSTGTLNVAGYNYLVWANQSDLKGTTSGIIAQGAKDKATLDALIQLARPSDVVYLAKNITGAGQIELSDKNITLNLNGKELSGSILTEKDLVVMNGKITSKNTNQSGIETRGEAKLTVNNVNIVSKKHAISVKSKGAVVINGGTYRLLEGGHNTQHAINIGAADIKADVTIKNGNFIGPKSLPVIDGAAVCVQGESKLTIEGGVFSKAKAMDLIYKTDTKGSVVVSGGKFDKNIPTSYLATGYESKAIEGGDYNGWFEVKAK